MGYIQIFVSLLLRSLSVYLSPCSLSLSRSLSLSLSLPIFIAYISIRTIQISVCLSVSFSFSFSLPVCLSVFHTPQHFHYSALSLSFLSVSFKSGIAPQQTYQTYRIRTPPNTHSHTHTHVRATTHIHIYTCTHTHIQLVMKLDVPLIESDQRVDT